MKTVSRLLQILALGALLGAQVHGSFSMPGVRQALRIVGGQPSQVFCRSGKQMPVAIDPVRFGGHAPVPAPCPA